MTPLRDDGPLNLRPGSGPFKLSKPGEWGDGLPVTIRRWLAHSRVYAVRLTHGGVAFAREDQLREL